MSALSLLPARLHVAILPEGTWTDLFTMSVPVIDKAARTVLVYLAIAVLLRVAGKRLLAQMNNLDLVVVLLLSNVVQNAIIGPDDSVSSGPRPPPEDRLPPADLRQRRRRLSLLTNGRAPGPTAVGPCSAPP